MQLEDHDKFIIRAEGGHFLLQILEVFGFPKETCHWGGYDTKSYVEIVTPNYAGKGELYISTGEVFTFYSELKEAFKTLIGSAKLTSYEGNLNVIVSFDGLGHAEIEGSFQIYLHETSQLHFELHTDQTYLQQSINDLEKIIGKYGDNSGITR